jgi:hypothetical protein
MPNKLSMPLGSWESLKKIIRAYGQVEGYEKPTVEDVAKYAGMPRPVVSSNNNFLREIGVLIEGENKPTPLGSRLAQSLSMENEHLIAETLQEIVRTNPVLNQFVGIVKARRGVKTDLLKGEIALASSLTDRTRQPAATKTILDMLQEAKLLNVTEDMITVGSVDKPPAEDKPYLSPNAPMGSGSSASPNAPMGQGQMPRGIPLPLGPSRLAFIQLPDDWQPKELGKLIRILQVALGESDEP